MIFFFFKNRIIEENTYQNKSVIENNLNVPYTLCQIHLEVYVVLFDDIKCWLLRFSGSQIIFNRDKTPLKIKKYTKSLNIMEKTKSK